MSQISFKSHKRKGDFDFTIIIKLIVFMLVLAIGALIVNNFISRGEHVTGLPSIGPSAL